MALCPDGHDSANTDFCDVCGIRIAGPAVGQPSASPAWASPAAASPAAAGSGAASPAAARSGAASPAAADPAGAGQGAEPCPQCGTERAGQFCEVCGYDFARQPTTAPPVTQTQAGPLGAPDTRPRGGPPSPAARTTPAWTAVVRADRAYYDAVIAAGGPDAGSIQFPGYCPERRFPLAGTEMRIGRRSASRGLEPEIDLTGPPADPGISHLHAVLIAQPDGSWSVLDPGSANGTQVNGADIEPGHQVPLRDRDRVCLGAWTVLTVQADGPDH